MASAQLTALRNIAAPILTIEKTARGWEVRRRGILMGVCQTHAGALELYWSCS